MLIEVKRFLVSSAVEPAKIGASTSLYLIALIALSFYLSQQLLDRTGFKLGKNFLISTTFYAFPLAALSAFLPLQIGATAGVLIMFLSIILCKKLDQQGIVDKSKSYLVTGIFLALMVLPFLNFDASLISLAGFAPFLALALLLSKSMEGNILYAFLGQYFDGITSYFILSSNGSEINVLGSLFVEVFGPSGILVMKTVLVAPATYYIFLNTSEKKTFYMFLIGFIGLAVGLANLFRLG